MSYTNDALKKRYQSGFAAMSCHEAMALGDLGSMRVLAGLR